jgi:hypothetical protein
LWLSKPCSIYKGWLIKTLLPAKHSLANTLFAPSITL